MPYTQLNRLVSNNFVHYLEVSLPNIKKNWESKMASYLHLSTPCPQMESNY
jgi:hypothetical protein